MEIHPPPPVTSWKEFLRELATITTGILIALSLEGLLQWKQHRDLVREARGNIISELRENQRELTGEDKNLQQMRENVNRAINLIHQLETNRYMPLDQFHSFWSIAELHSTSWNTARSTGAISYMPYPEVKRYTEVYDLQQTFEDLQQRALTSALDVQGLATLLSRNTTAISSAELSDSERRLGLAMANVFCSENNC